MKRAQEAQAIESVRPARTTKTGTPVRVNVDADADATAAAAALKARVELVNSDRRGLSPVTSGKVNAVVLQNFSSASPSQGAEQAPSELGQKKRITSTLRVVSILRGCLAEEFPELTPQFANYSRAAALLSTELERPLTQSGPRNAWNNYAYRANPPKFPQVDPRKFAKRCASWKELDSDEERKTAELIFGAFHYWNSYPSGRQDLAACMDTYPHAERYFYSGLIGMKIFREMDFKDCTVPETIETNAMKDNYRYFLKNMEEQKPKPPKPAR